MLKAKIFSTTNVNALTSKKKKKILSNLVLKENIILLLFLSLLVNDCILIYIETTMRSIYNFLIPYGCLSKVFFFLLRSSLA